MSALDRVTSWPVPHSVAAIVRSSDGSPPATYSTIGDTGRSFRLASLTKTVTGLTALIACEAIRCWCSLCKDVEAPFALRQEAAAALGDAAEVRSQHTNIECSTRRAPSSGALFPT